uniref:Major facilitator superfamily (MFS) profile domain-containing protein n=2 Tax=Clastoptera arizonana TaxID=38151 RepID=A0A1B6CR93_9HEMI
MICLGYKRRNYYFTVFIGNLTMIALGNAYAWTSPTLPILMSNNDSVFPLVEDEASWIASLFSLGAAIGPLIAAPVKETIGFKWSFSLISTIMVISWIGLASLWNIYIFYFARLIAGINFCILPLYIAEISEDELRTTINSLSQFFRCLAYLEEYVFGSLVSYYSLILISSLASLLHLTLVYWSPESPYYLIAKGNTDKAQKTVAWLRGGSSQESLDSIKQIQAFLDRSKNGRSWKDLTTFVNLKAIFIVTSLLCLQQTSGLTVMLVYTVKLFEMTGTSISPNMSSIIFGVVYAIGAIFGPIMTLKYGVKRSLILSAFGVFLSEEILGLFLYFNAYGYDMSSFFWCPIVCTILYAVTYNIGLGPLPATIMSEVFPANVKAKASAICQTIGFIVGFTIAKFFPILSEKLGIYSVFWMFGSSGIFVIILTVYLVPNTKGLSLDQIQDILSGNKKS